MRFISVQKSLIISAILFTSFVSYSAEESGWFGFGVDIDGKGRPWNPVLESVVINKIEPLSPAAGTRMKVGDKLLEIEGNVLIGERAKTLSPHMKKAPGEALNLVLEDLDGNAYESTLIAGQQDTNES